MPLRKSTGWLARNTFTPGDQAFPAEQARRLLRGLEFRLRLEAYQFAQYVRGRDRRARPTMSRLPHRQLCPSRQRDRSMGKHRNAERARIDRMFTTEKARAKLGRALSQDILQSAESTKESKSLCPDARCRRAPFSQIAADEREERGLPVGFRPCRADRG